MDTFGCACPIDEGNALIDNSEAGELIENNSQWHPGFSDIGSVPGNPSIGTVPPTTQTVAQATAVTIADLDFLDDDEGETDDETDEDIDEIDDVDDAFDEDALDEEEEDLIAASTWEASEVEHIFSNQNFISSNSEDSELPDLEEVPSESLTYQQLLEGNT